MIGPWTPLFLFVLTNFRHGVMLLFCKSRGNKESIKANGIYDLCLLETVFNWNQFSSPTPRYDQPAPTLPLIYSI